MVSTQDLTKKVQQTYNNLQDQTKKSGVLSTLKGSTNIGPLERWTSGVAGGLLTSYGITRRDWLGAALALFGGSFVCRALTGHSYVYQALGFNTAAQNKRPGVSVGHGKGIKVERAVTINKPRVELYRYWRNFENLPNFMQHLKSVKVIDDMRSHWVAKGPLGATVEWDAQIINKRENELIAWRSVGNADIDNAGSVHFTPAPDGRGTIVKVVLEYDPPAGRFGSLLAKLFGEDPDQQVREDLRHFKEIMEAGEIPTTEGQSSGRSK
ncbi:MAG: SRPBCC family protein [Ktedonobacteraceae bacterium]